MRYGVNAPQAIHQTIEGEVILINLATGSYYSLRDTGAEIFGMVEAGLSFEEIGERLAARYEVDPAEARVAAEGLVDRLRDERLVVPLEGEPPASPSAPEMSDGRSAFAPPVLERFDDMRDLILLDPVHEVDAAEGWPHPPAE